ncbi:MAG: aminotransferase class I/II-fold pyridoxal phosphate-dependent enzyme [Novosphingobium sp.]|uniref:pyridoxal phosphate-dependent aminotransferase n=1 Tax=Novosphingobium sp. TaxID=1874826 RepID=UPI003C7CE7EC
MTAAIDPFKAMFVSQLAHKLEAEGQSVIHMEFGQPSTGAPTAAIARAHEVLDADAMGYWESPLLKQRICAQYTEKYGAAVSPAQIILTCGASPALVLALSSAFAPGARVAMARPGYVAYRNNLKALHMVPVEIDCGAEAGYQLTAKALAAIDPAPDGVILASPANPTGTIIPRDELAAIAQICRERGITVISDEIYHGISYGMETPSILEVMPEAWVVNSFSKYFSMAGWRLGWLVAPELGVDPARARMSNLFLTPPSLSQHAGLVAMDCHEELESHIATYTRNRELLLAALPDLGLARIAPPDGAFYVYADVSDFTDDSMEFCKQLVIDTGVATAPGVDFDPVHGHRFMRFSFAVSTPLIEEAIRRMKPWFAERNRGMRG